MPQVCPDGLFHDLRHNAILCYVNYGNFAGRGGFCLVVEFHREGSAINEAAPSSFALKKITLPLHYLTSLSFLYQALPIKCPTEEKV